MERDRERFSLIVLEPHEIYFEDFLVNLLPNSATSQTVAANDPVSEHQEPISGRLKLCSKSLVFDPKNIRLPMLKFHFAHCQVFDSSHRDNCLIVSTSQHVQLLENNRIAPYKFVGQKQSFVFHFLYVKVRDRVIPFCQQLHRASSLHPSEQNDMIATIVYSLHNRSKFDPLWLDSIYEKILFDCKVNEVNPLVLNPGRLLLTNNCIYFQPYNNIRRDPVIKIKLKTVTMLRRRRFLLKHTGLEIQWTDNKHIYVSFQNENELLKFLSLANEQSDLHLPHVEPESMTLRWKNRVISNYEYLLYLNHLAYRSFEDLTQYPVFPWVLTDYSSPTLDLNDETIYRDLRKPIGALNPQRLARLKERCEEMGDPKYLYGSHYSTPGFVLFYLVRKFPHLMLCLQNGRFDHPDRMFNKVEETFNNCLRNMSDFKELIPEFYDTTQAGDFLVNVYKIDFGTRFDGKVVHDVVLPPWAENSPKVFVQKMRDALESDYVSANLHHWIDLIFGYKSKGLEAEKADNLFYPLCYEGSVDLDDVKDPGDRHALEVQISEFGQIPKQLFDKPHVSRYPRTPPNGNGNQLKISNTESSTPESQQDFKLNLVTSYTAHKDLITFVMFDGDNVVSTGKDGVLKCYSLKEKRQIRNIAISHLPVSSCVKVPESNIFACGLWDNSILLYNCNYGKVSDTIPAHDDSVSCMSINEELGILISGSWDCTVKIWRGFRSMGYRSFRLSSSLVACYTFDDKISDIAHSTINGQMQILIATESGEILLWELPLTTIQNTSYSQMPDPRVILKHPKSVTSLALNNEKLASCSSDGLLLVTDISTEMNLFTRELSSSPSCLSWCNGFDYLLCVDDTGELFVWDMVRVLLKFQLKISAGPLTFVRYSKEAGMIATAGRDGKDFKIKCWTFT